MSSSHFGVHSSYLRLLGARDAHVLVGLTLLQFYLGHLETHFICEHRTDQSSPATAAQNSVLHTYLKHIAAHRAWQAAAPSTAALHHTAAFTPDICHPELSYLTWVSLASRCEALAKTAA